MANTENWFVVYDIRDTLPWVEICIMLILVTLSVGVPLAVLKSSRSKFLLNLALNPTPVPRWVYRLFALSYAVGGSVFAVCFSFVLYHTLFLRSERAFSTANVAVGTISAVEPIQKKENTVLSERFDVGEQQFVVRSNRLGTGLTQLAAEGGPCRAGRQVRITFSGVAILRVEVTSEEPAVSPSSK